MRDCEEIESKYRKMCDTYQRKFNTLSKQQTRTEKKKKNDLQAILNDTWVIPLKPRDTFRR